MIPISAHEMIFLAIFLVLVIIEMIYGAIRHIRLYSGADTFNNLALGIATTIFKTFVMAGPVYAWFGLFHNKGWVLFPGLSESWWSWVLLVILNDFVFYWFHRWSHEIRILWASHVVHHNSRIMNFSTSVRGVFVIMGYRFLFFTPLAVLGFDPVQIILMDQIAFVYQLVIHTETIKSWGILEWILNSPSHHRVHHASNPQYLDKNYGAILIIYDRLFGTFAKEVEKPEYGLLTNLQKDNIFVVAFHEFVGLFKDISQAKSMSEAWNLFFNHPGWKHYPIPRKAFLKQLMEE